MDAVLELRRICKEYTQHRAVQDVSLKVPRGSLFALVGPSGCGKTTTLRMIAGFEHPTSGELLLNGERIEHLRPYERNVSTVFQSYALFPNSDCAARERKTWSSRFDACWSLCGWMARNRAIRISYREASGSVWHWLVRWWLSLRSFCLMNRSPRSILS
jgi:ABC-type branched-subunit amino acid transport system ATPase component